MIDAYASTTATITTTSRNNGPEKYLVNRSNPQKSISRGRASSITASSRLPNEVTFKPEREQVNRSSHQAFASEASSFSKSRDMLAASPMFSCNFSTIPPEYSSEHFSVPCGFLFEVHLAKLNGGYHFVAKAL